MEPNARRGLHLLEIDLVSAQGLKTPVKLIPGRTRSYVVSYIEPSRKLCSRIDKLGRKNPTWNDKFYFAVDPDELRRNISKAVVFEIYCVRSLLKDKLVGTARVLLHDLIHSSNRYKGEGMRGTFHAYQIRRPESGEPRGILNIGARMLEGSSYDYEVMSEFLELGHGNVDHNKLMGNGGRTKMQPNNGGCLPNLYYCLMPRLKSSHNNTRFMIPNQPHKHNLES